MSKSHSGRILYRELLEKSLTGAIFKAIRSEALTLWIQIRTPPPLSLKMALSAVAAA